MSLQATRESNKKLPSVPRKGVDSLLGKLATKSWKLESRFDADARRLRDLNAARQQKVWRVFMARNLQNTLIRRGIITDAVM